MRIALDAMGGDHGPAPNVGGAALALASNPDLTVVLVGDQGQLDPLLAASPLPAGRVEVVHAAQVVEMKEKPAEALRRKPDASVFRAWKLLAEGNVDGLVSAGNTGAVVAGGVLSRRFLPGVHKPGIATVMPTAKGRCVIMDVGANVFPKPRHLLQYGAMGSVFAKHVLNIEKPSLGLMNVGEEEGKGHELVQKTYELFRNSPLSERFVGNIEGRDIHRGAVDVVVTDGFTGNVVLKLSEGVLEFVVGLISHEVIGTLSAERDQAALALKTLLAKYHYSAVGGAPLLGVEGVCIICHGSSKDKAIASALGVAALNVRVKLNEKIVAELAALPKGDE
ncbi:Phosphate acyltransferase [Gemmata obscuriglobus]|uniref:Phosphate acyltransferase n=1 Tax=Gemmata obscuriglobus TaxID=114 RepID=A0A2Z3H9X8_9BACT|nr:phosphate acyltransferase PlsX [Gemmata obscuriglobus]AWM40426.1 phosphate acyltransferase PlsX [Gemmata obscuriglobus]QEG26337.1 Phosphate acyltransferase [Gemmata obscuriglobus]VTS01300.1 phosphate acyltransferase : Phosphate acyltransferase OS=uncultured Acidobacteria bacterium A2 GN=plsX PE=3 SV=1: FA_synthesis [Gemmata obscuriglobus UQM 2246]